MAAARTDELNDIMADLGITSDGIPPVDDSTLPPPVVARDTGAAPPPLPPRSSGAPPGVPPPKPGTPKPRRKPAPPPPGQAPAKPPPRPAVPPPKPTAAPPAVPASPTTSSPTPPPAAAPPVATDENTVPAFTEDPDMDVTVANEVDGMFADLIGGGDGGGGGGGGAGAPPPASGGGGAAGAPGPGMEGTASPMQPGTEMMSFMAPAGAPPCALCREGIVGRSITAMNKPWHPEHFVCAQCFQPFPNGQYFVFEDKPYCEADFQELFGNRCAGCRQPVVGRCVNALEKKWHPEHFVCSSCRTNLAGGSFVERDGDPYCKNCQAQASMANRGGAQGGMMGGGAGGAFDPSSLCGQCNKPVVGPSVTIQGQKNHPEHYACVQCRRPFIGIKFYMFDNRLYCEDDFQNLKKACCAACKKPIQGRCVTALNKQWHPQHFVCHHCRKPFTDGQFFEHEGAPYCELHYHAFFGTLCAKCGKQITGRGVSALGQQWHPEHFVCVGCDKALAGGTFCEWDSKPMCKKCFLRLPAHLRRRLAKSKRGGRA